MIVQVRRSYDRRAGLKGFSYEKSFYQLFNSLSVNFRDNLINKGLEQVKKFSWDICFSETYKFYEETYKRKFG